MLMIIVLVMFSYVLGNSDTFKTMDMVYLIHILLDKITSIR